MKILIQSNPETAYAAAEAKRFLSEYTNAEFVTDGEADRKVVLSVDTAMEPHHYHMTGDGSVLKIRGGNASSVLCGVCEALAGAGISFEANGYSVPKAFSADAFFSVNRTVKPKFRLRGIRQHINFTMDISAYPLKDAKEYIRSIARMRYNAITFHTYPGQWHETRPDDPDDHAGHFFYGQVNPVPADDPLTASRVNNRKYYCIPEAEAIFEDEAARSAYAKYWLNEVMKTAKEAGLTVTLSVEIITDDMDEASAMLRNILRTYPLIDTLELISEECGGFRDIPGLTYENVTGFITGLFGEEILDENGALPGLPDFLPEQLGSSAVCLKRLLSALSVRKQWLEGLEKVPALRGGLYLTCPDTLRILRPVLRRFLPEGMTMSLLPAHGALAAADNIERTGTLSSDWQNTMFYSWAEFDGNMFVQQMSTEGIEKLTSMPDTDSSYGYCINHWRTAENSLAICYSAEAAITGMKADEYYRLHADRIGIGDVSGFAHACARLAALDSYNRDNLFNIGFCVISCWMNWHRRGNVMLPRLFPAEYLNHAKDEYTALIGEWKALLPAAVCREGIQFLRLLINRCETSILHIKALAALDEIVLIYDYDDPKPLTPEQSEKIREIIERARSYTKEYIHHYGEILPDRGGEGQLVSYAITTPVFIDAVAANFDSSIVVADQEQYDAPPMPDDSVLDKE